MEKRDLKADLDKRLDDALADTFPCSDPFSFQMSIYRDTPIPKTQRAEDKISATHAIETQEHIASQ